jgi:hypothetical protein
LQEGQLLVAQRCFASLGDIVRVRFIQETLIRAERALNPVILQDNLLEQQQQISAHYEVRARLAQMRKQFKLAERIYLENVCCLFGIYFFMHSHLLYHTNF